MTGNRTNRALLILLCISLCALWSYDLRRHFQGPVKMPDFAEIYFGARCAMLHKDPYNPNAVFEEYAKEDPQLGQIFLAQKSARIVVTVDVNLPTTLWLSAPLAMLPWPVVQNLWLVLSAALLAVAAWLMCDLAPGAKPTVSLCLAGFVLLNCEELLTVGNVAGFCVGLCLIAVWCFLKNRVAWAGVVFLGISLVVKPHDAGLVWLFFFLAGSAMRKRALQSLAFATILVSLAAIWIAPISPHWISELHNNLASVSARGGTSDPGLTGLTSRTTGEVVDLQAALSVIQNDPRFNGPASYLVAGTLILVWAIAALRKRFSPDSALVALAAISALSLLPVYHRTHDAKILMLAIPGCALLWSGNGARRWIAVALTTAAIVVTSDIPLQLLLIATRNLPASPSTLSEKIVSLLLLEPAPLVLLIAGVFYLWVYWGYDPVQRVQNGDKSTRSESFQNL